MRWKSLAPCLILFLSLSLSLSFSLFPVASWGAGKARSPKESEPFDGKKGIALFPVPATQIELPDGTWDDFGQDYQARLTTELTQSEKYFVVDLHPTPTSRIKSLRSDLRLTDDFVWNSSHTPSAYLKVSIKTMSFVTGSRGGRMFYGFDEKFKTPFNDGSEQIPNEFPLKEGIENPSWFLETFAPKGTSPFDSLSGLDLGEGFNINLLFAWLGIKYASYRSRLGIELEFSSIDGTRREVRKIEVKGHGFFFDAVAGYQAYSGAIRVARRDAMLQAFQKVTARSFKAIQKVLADFPHLTRIDHITKDSKQGTVYLLGTGPNAGIRPGLLYEAIEKTGLVFEVTKSTSSGAIAILVTGNAQDVIPGMLLKETTTASLSTLAAHGPRAQRMALLAAPAAAVTENHELEPENFERSDFGNTPIPNVSMIAAFFKSLVEASLLPYRIWRYFQYDQKYRAPDESDQQAEGDSQYPVDVWQWHEKAIESDWGKKIHLSRLDITTHEASPVVAIIDTGVDYNHPLLRHSIWQNPGNPGNKEVGWDFISGDSRPYDDHYHGTQVASTVLAVAPHAKIMVIKVFNPWGVTNSAALSAAFDYAVQQGAKILLCAWNTRTQSKAIRRGVEQALEQGALVVASAGNNQTNLGKRILFPASLSRLYENVVTVAGVNSKNQLYKLSGSGALTVSIGAPAESIEVAEPRWNTDTLDSTDFAAAQVAGALARIQSQMGPQTDFRDWKDQLYQNALSIDALENAIKEGLILNIPD